MGFCTCFCMCFLHRLIAKTQEKFRFFTVRALACMPQSSEHAGRCSARGPRVDHAREHVQPAPSLADITPCPPRQRERTPRLVRSHVPRRSRHRSSVHPVPPQHATLHLRLQVARPSSFYIFREGSFPCERIGYS